MNLEIDMETIVKDVLSEEQDKINMLPEYVERHTADLIREEMENFEYQIKSRGKDYYEKGNIKSLVKHGDSYYAKVNGTRVYDIKIYVDPVNDYVHCECDCPYEWECKHEYAVLMAILNKDYNEVQLKREINKKKISLEELIKLIPADDLKNYILSPIGKDYVCFETEHLEENFAKYIPIQSYEYYYNNLYNALVIDGYDNGLLSEYIKNIKTLLNSKKYIEVFSIIKSIIEASHDTNHLDKWDQLIEEFPLLGMHLRIVYRKANNELKNTIDKWTDNLISNEFYNNIYLEDIILSIK